TRYGEQLDERAAEIAWHWEGAEERGTAARWYARAASWMEQRDVRAALRHARAASDLLPEIPEDRAEAELLIQICSQLLLFGWLLGQTDAESSALLERGVRAAEHLGDIGAQVRLRIAYANTRMTRGRIAEFLVHARESARRADESGDEALRALTCFELAVAEGFTGNLDACEQSLQAFFRCDAGAALVSVLTQRAVAHGWRGYVLQYRGRMAEAAAEIAPARETAASEPLTQALVSHLIFLFAEARGEYPAAMELATRMLTLAETSGAINLRAVALGGLARAHALRAEWRETAQLFEEA